MSNSALKLLAGAGAKDGPVYVDDVFSTFLYNGNGSTQTITNNIDLSGKGGLVWIKNRTAADNHILTDTDRGVTKVLNSNTYAESATDADTLTAFNSDGFALGDDDKVNTNAENFVSWTFRKQEGFFDIVSYTGDGTTNRQISHNLGSVPGMILLKNTDPNNQAWYVYHVSAGATHYQQLNSSGPFYDDAGPWNDTTPTDTVFTLGLPGYTNTNGYNYIVYLFANNEAAFGDDEDEAIIKCGSYTGNGTSSSSTQHIDLGFEPQFIMIKTRTLSGQDWFIYDSMRGWAGHADSSSGDMRLMASDNASEYQYLVGHPTPTGFQLIGNENEVNKNSEPYVYMAIRRPHKPASEFANTELFKVAEATGNPAPNVVSGFPVDMALFAKPTDTSSYNFLWRLSQGKRIDIADSNTDAQDYQDGAFDFQNGIVQGGFSTGNYGWMFRRAPKFFEVVRYVGNGSANHQVTHNLGMAPGWVIYKSLSYNGAWWLAYSSALGSASDPYYGKASGNNAFSNDADVEYFFYDTAPSSTVLTLGTSYMTNNNGSKYIAFMFGNVDGLCKTGSYTGTGNDVNVDCGFSSGARFVVVKRTDSTGHWFVWDTVRGINAGNEDVWKWSNDAARLTGYDYIDPLSSGFTITSSAPSELNASGGTYIFLAIA